MQKNESFLDSLDKGNSWKSKSKAIVIQSFLPLNTRPTLCPETKLGSILTNLVHQLAAWVPSGKNQDMKLALGQTGIIKTPLA